LVAALVALGLCGTAVAQSKTVVKQGEQKRNCPFIVSPSRPSDSRGETVYEIQGADQMDIPAVPGACVLPVIQSVPKVQFPKELKDAKFSALVNVVAVVTAQGDVVDAKAPDGADPRAADTAVKAAMGFKFKPATLDGKPVALLMLIPVHFSLKKFWGGTYPTDGPPPSATP
jgi:hypothetical protein